MIQPRAPSMCVIAAFASMTWTSGCSSTTADVDGPNAPARRTASGPAEATLRAGADGLYGAAGDKCRYCNMCPGFHDANQVVDREVWLKADELPPEIVAAARRALAEVQPEIAGASWVKGYKTYSLYFQSEVFMTEDGTITDVISPIAEVLIPPAAAATLRKAIDGMEGIFVTRFEKETRFADDEYTGDERTADVKRFDSPLVLYSAQYFDGQTMGELEVDAAGKIVSPPAWDKPLPSPGSGTHGGTPPIPGQ